MSLRHTRVQKGFSLVELMIVIVIIGILAAIGIPMYFDNIYKAKRAEGIASMGSIRSQIQMYYAENGFFPVEDPKDYVVGADWNHIKPGELQGINFSDSSFFYESRSGLTWEITVDHQTTFLDEDLKLQSDGTIIGN